MKKTIACSILLCMLAALGGGCSVQQPGEDDIRTIDPQKAMDVPLSKHISLLDHDFVLRSDAERNKISVNRAFSSGYEMKQALFMHPTSATVYTLVDFMIDLSGFGPGSLILLEYSVGIADGVQADGVEFVSMVDDTLLRQTISKENRWIAQYIDLSAYAGKTVKLSLGTKGSPTTNYAWAAFGDPSINAVAANTGSILSGGEDDIQANVSGSLVRSGGSMDGKGKVIIEVPEFTNGDAYVVVSGKGSPELTASLGNRSAREVDLGSGSGSYRYLIPIGSPIIRRSDWSLALGLPEEKIAAHEHDYFLDGGRSFALELDSEEAYTVDGIEVWRKPGIAEVRSLVQGAYAERTDSDTFMNVTYRNSGSGVFLRDDGFALRMEYTDPKGRTRKIPGIRIPDMAVMTDYWHSFNLGRLAAGLYDMKLFLVHSAGEELLAEKAVEVRAIDIAIAAADSLSIEDSALRLVIPKIGDGYEAGYLYEKKSQNLIGTFALPRLATETSDSSIASFEGEKSSEGRIVLRQTSGDASVSITYEIRNSKIHVTHTLDVNADIKLKAFDGPLLLFGNEAFGRDHDNAIFAGIDYLSAEPSNNTLAAAYPYSERFAPNPKKITAPVMLVSNGGMVIQYSWYPDKEWSDGETMPMARFEAPSLSGADYGIMGIFAPSGSQYLKENTLEAYNPKPMKAGSQITLEAEVKVLYEDDSAEGMAEFLKDRGIPEIPALNKEPLDVYRALVKGLDAELEDERGWIGFLGLDTDPSVDRNAIHALITAQALLDSQDRLLAKDVLSRVNIPGAAFEWSYADSIYWRMETDYLDEYYSGTQSRMDALLKSQGEDGTWTFNPANNKDRLFGRPGDVTMGTVAVPAIQLVKAARLTGSKSALEGARKAVKALAAFTKPAGAGPWELPNTNPDSLAVFLGLKASLDLYEYTQDPEALAAAAAIAKKSLPFIYFTEIPRKPVSAYGVIASFGATNWQRMWQGSPVQWIGAFLSEELKRLGAYDQTLDWKKIGDGITAAGINLVNDSRQPGRFPDYVDIYKSDTTIYNIWGNLVARNVSCDLGYQSEWDQAEQGGVRVVSGYEITGMALAGDTLTVTVIIPDGMPCYLMVRAAGISAVRAGAAAIEETSGPLSMAATGYRRMDNGNSYAIKATGTSTETRIEITIGK